MSEIYQFVWGEVEAIEGAIFVAKRIKDEAEYAHIETEHYDLDTDKIGIRIRIPHNRELNQQRESM